MSDANSKLPNLNTKTEEFISMLEQRDNAPLYTLSPDGARDFLDSLQIETHKEIDADVADINVPAQDTQDIEVRVVRPKNSTEKLPVILYIHGGGWVMGGKESFDMLIRKLAVCTDSAVFFPEYSLSPEAQYPQALNEISRVLEYIYNNAKELNIDNTKIAIAGDSAGGNMATVTALAVKKALQKQKENKPDIIFECLFYPVTNADMDTKSYDSFKDGPWLSKKAMEWFFEAYVPEKKLRDDATISPLKASEEELALLPPTLIITDENDVLRDEGEAYARKLDSAGVDVLNVRINGTIHDFVMLNALSDTFAAKGALDLACKMLKDALHE